MTLRHASFSLYRDVGMGFGGDIFGVHLYVGHFGVLGRGCSDGTYDAFCQRQGCLGRYFALGH